MNTFKFMSLCPKDQEKYMYELSPNKKINDFINQLGGENLDKLCLSNPHLIEILILRFWSNSKFVPTITKTELSSFSYRKKYIEAFGWSIPNIKIAQQISDFAGSTSIIGIYSGMALWEMLIQKCHNHNIVATDVNPPSKTFMHVEKKYSTDAVSHYVDQNYKCLFMSWAPYNNPNTETVVSAFFEKGGEKIVIV
jgi:hypothetical protein